jgi:hypothetical protein
MASNERSRSETEQSPEREGSAPVQQLHDCKYTMLLAENILRHGDFDLSRYDLPSDDYRLRPHGAHRYYFLPVAPAVLSLPFVAAMRTLGHSTVAGERDYHERGELEIDKCLAAVLMAGFAALA